MNSGNVTPPIPRLASAILRVLVVLFASTAVAEQTNDAWTLPRLMNDMAQITVATARFAEERHLPYLDEPIRTYGTLHYRAPSYLEKRVHRPTKERAVIEGDQLVIESYDGGPSVTARISDYPVLRVITTSLRAILAGDIEALRRDYSIDFRGGATEWTLWLTPRQDELRLAVKTLRLGGVANKVTYLEITETNGARTIMRISEAP